MHQVSSNMRNPDFYENTLQCLSSKLPKDRKFFCLFALFSYIGRDFYTYNYVSTKLLYRNARSYKKARKNSCSRSKSICNTIQFYSSDLRNTETISCQNRRRSLFIFSCRRRAHTSTNK